MKKPHSLYTELLCVLSLVLFVLLSSVLATAFFLYRTSVLTTANQHLYATSEQLLGTYDSYFSQILKNSDAVIYYYNLIDNKTEFNERMDEYFSNMLSLKEEMISVSLYEVDSGDLIASAGSSGIYDNAKNEEWFKQTFATPEDKLIPVLSIPKKQNPAYPNSFSISRYASYDKNNKYDSILHISISFNAIVDLLSETALEDGGTFLIYDKTYQTVYSSINEDSSKKLKILEDFVVGSGIYKIDNHSYFVFASSISDTSWRLGVFLNYDAVNQSMMTFSIYLVAIGLVLFVLGSLIFFWAIKRSVKPIRNLSKEMSEIVSLEDIPSKKIIIEGSKEVIELDNSFKALISRIEELTKKVIHEKEEQRKSELLALQNQINPHFLYNTLDSILALIDKNENIEAEEMIVALSRFFRISISKGKNIIPLRKEIEHANNYLLIQKLRFKDAFDYKFDVDESILNFEVVKLILQPIIENSINHGLKEGEKGFITIKGYKENGFIILKVIDNGYGMLDETRIALEKSLKSDEDSKGVGLKNVYLRLKVYFGEKADIKIESKLDEGTTITLLIPTEGVLK